MSANATGITLHFDNMSREDFFKNFHYPAEKVTWKDLPVWEVALKIGVVVLLMVLSLVGNGLVLIVLLKKKSLRNVTNMFMVNLVLADILVTLSNPWIHVVEDLSERYMLGAFICKYSAVFQGECTCFG